MEKHSSILHRMLNRLVPPIPPVSLPGKSSIPHNNISFINMIRSERGIPHFEVPGAIHTNLQPITSGDDGEASPDAVGGEWEIGTQIVHAGEKGVDPTIFNSMTTPIVQTAAFFFRDTKELISYQEGHYKSHRYARYGNPTSKTLEEKIKALEGAEAALVSASGMNSITVLLLALIPPGGHIVTTTDCYRQTRKFVQKMLPKMNITSTVIDPSDIEALRRVLEERQVSMFLTESPTNPYLYCVDVEKVSELCHRHGALVVIDGTFATAINQRALSFGADLTVHSATKYMAGHNDVMAGVIAGRKELVEEVREWHKIFGGVIDPHASYLVLRGLKTLKVRVRKQNETASRLAEALEGHPKIRRVYYPGLPSHPSYRIAKRQLKGFGGVVSFEIDGDLWRTSKFIDSVQLPYIAPSLGGTETLIEQPAVMSYWDAGSEGRANLGISDSLVRFSCGIEDFEDIWADISQALDNI